MIAPNYRAWRFVHPDLDRGEGRAGLRISPRGSIDMVSEHESIRQALLLLLSTVPGERVMRPGYGCELGRLVFSPNDDTTAGLAAHYVRQAIRQWEPRIEITGLKTSPRDGPEGALLIEFEYRAKGTLHTAYVTLTLDLTGEQLP